MMLIQLMGDSSCAHAAASPQYTKTAWLGGGQLSYCASIAPMQRTTQELLRAKSVGHCGASTALEKRCQRESPYAGRMEALERLHYVAYQLIPENILFSLTGQPAKGRSLKCWSWTGLVSFLEFVQRTLKDTMALMLLQLQKAGSEGAISSGLALFQMHQMQQPVRSGTYDLEQRKKSRGKVLEAVKMARVSHLMMLP